MALPSSPLVSPITPFLGSRSRDAAFCRMPPASASSPWSLSPTSSLRRPSDRRPSRQASWNWQSYHDAAAAADDAPRPRSPSVTTLDSPHYDLPSIAPLSIPARPRPDPLRIPGGPRRSVSTSAAPAPDAPARARADSLATLEHPDDLHMFAEAMTGLDAAFFAPPPPPHPQSAGPSSRAFAFPAPAADALRPAPLPATSVSQPASRAHTPDLAAARPDAPRRPPPADPSRAFAESLLSMADGHDDDDDELPDYATSQREAANANRMQALQRAQELERRWTAARGNRRRG